MICIFLHRCIGGIYTLRTPKLVTLSNNFFYLRIKSHRNWGAQDHLKNHVTRHAPTPYADASAANQIGHNGSKHWQMLKLVLLPGVPHDMQRSSSILHLLRKL